MKTSELKNLIKEAVLDAIRDQMKDLLLEAFKALKTTIQETRTPQTDYKPTFTQPTFDAREKYANILGESAMGFTSRYIKQLNPAVADPANGNFSLPTVNIQIGQNFELFYLCHKNFKFIIQTVLNPIKYTCYNFFHTLG
jgi:hypothetical protein